MTDYSAFLSSSDGSDPTAPLEARLRYCAAMLHIHGAVTDAERLKINARLLKKRAATAKKGSAA